MKKPIGLKIDIGIDEDIRAACRRHRLKYVQIVEQGAGSLARKLLQQEPLSGMNEEIRQQDIVN